MTTYRTALKEARASFNQATKRLDEIEKETRRVKSDISKLRRTITALAAMCSEEPMIDSLGITDSCIEVMREQDGTVSTMDVVKELEAKGFDLASQKNAPASVHAILSRLAGKGTIKKIEGDEGSVGWRGPNYDPDFDAIFSA